MAFIRKEFTKFALKEETTEGTYAAPANSDFIQLTEEGATIDKTREVIEDNRQTGDRIVKSSILANKSVTASFTANLTANKTAGIKPAYSEAIESLGFKSSGLASADTLLVGSTASVLKVTDASIYKVNDIIKVMATGAHHVSPISEVNTTTDEITLLIPCASAPAAGVTLAKSVLYRLDATAEKTLSITRVFEGDQVEERAVGCRTESLNIQNFSVGQIPQIAFSMMGLNFYDTLEPSSYVPDFSESPTTYVHNACIFKNDEELIVTEIGLSIEQTVSKISSTCAKNGAFASRGVGKYTVTANINPYKQDDEIGFSLNDEIYSLFWSVSNPLNEDKTETANNVAFFLPQLKTTQVQLADRDGTMTDAVTAVANPDSVSNSIVIAFF